MPRVTHAIINCALWVFSWEMHFSVYHIHSHTHTHTHTHNHTDLLHQHSHKVVLTKLHILNDFIGKRRRMDEKTLLKKLQEENK